MNLLIADDEIVIRKGLLSLDWESIGIDRVLSVSNGEEAKEVLLQESIDIGIFDIRMPGMTGLELAEMIYERDIDTAVVLLTGFSEFEYARKALRNGVYEYLLKPVRQSELLKTIASVRSKLEQKRQYQYKESEYKTAPNIEVEIQKCFLHATPAVADILKDIATRFSEGISLNNLAKKYHFSNGYLSKKIKQETGHSFMTILNTVRLTHATRLLQEGARIHEVCEKCGFIDQRYFSQVFRRAFGISPREYKKQKHDSSMASFANVLQKLTES